MFLLIEKDFSMEVKMQLEQMGYKVRQYGIAGYEGSIGRVELLLKLNGKIEAVADSRGDDTVAGY